MNDLDLRLEVVSMSYQPLREIRRWICRKPLEIQAWFQRTTNGKWHMYYQIVTWPVTSRDLERSNSWPQYAKSAISQKRLDLLETPFQRTTNSKWHGLSNYQMVTWPMTSRDPRRCCEAVRSAILATAWLLVRLLATPRYVTLPVSLLDLLLFKCEWFLPIKYEWMSLMICSMYSWVYTAGPITGINPLTPTVAVWVQL